MISLSSQETDYTSCDGCSDDMGDKTELTAFSFPEGSTDHTPNFAAFADACALIKG